MRRIQYATAGMVLVGAAITAVCSNVDTIWSALAWTLPICVAAVVCVWHIDRGVREERAAANPMIRLARQFAAIARAFRSDGDTPVGGDR